MNKPIHNSNRRLNRDKTYILKTYNISKLNNNCNKRTNKNNIHIRPSHTEILSKRSKNTYIKINSNSNRNNNKIINIKTIYNQNIKSLRKDLNKASNKASSKSISKLLRIALCNSNKFCCHCYNRNTLSI